MEKIQEKEKDSAFSANAFHSYVGIKHQMLPRSRGHIAMPCGRKIRSPVAQVIGFWYAVVLTHNELFLKLQHLLLVLGFLIHKVGRYWARGNHTKWSLKSLWPHCYEHSLFLGPWSCRVILPPLPNQVTHSFFVVDSLHGPLSQASYIYFPSPHSTR